MVGAAEIQRPSSSEPGTLTRLRYMPLGFFEFFRKTSLVLQSIFVANWRPAGRLNPSMPTNEHRHRCRQWKFVAAGNQCVPSH
jgi:hypothetical protein